MTRKHRGEQCVCVCGNLSWPRSSPELITAPERRKIQSVLGGVIKATISLISNLTHLKYCRPSLSWNPFMWKEQSALGLTLLFWRAFCLHLLCRLTPSYSDPHSLFIFLSIWRLLVLISLLVSSLYLFTFLYCSLTLNITLERELFEPTLLKTLSLQH